MEYIRNWRIELKLLINNGYSINSIEHPMNELFHFFPMSGQKLYAFSLAALLLMTKIMIHVFPYLWMLRSVYRGRSHCDRRNDTVMRLCYHCVILHDKGLRQSRDSAHPATKCTQRKPTSVYRRFPGKPFHKLPRKPRPNSSGGVELEVRFSKSPKGGEFRAVLTLETHLL